MLDLFLILINVFLFSVRVAKTMRNLKLVMMGAGGVGKTSMTTQFVRETFDER